MLDSLRSMGDDQRTDIAGTLLPLPIAPEEGAALTAFLLSDEARHITKSAYPISSGWTPL